MFLIYSAVINFITINQKMKEIKEVMITLLTAMLSAKMGIGQP